MNSLDRSFAALAHPARREIVRRLAGGPATVGAAAAGLGLSKPAVTKHLKVLEGSGLVARTVEGRTHRLRLVPRPLEEASGWIEHHRALWEAKLDAVDEWLKSSA